MRNIRILLLCFAFFQALLPARSVSADTGPKPGMAFTFKQETNGEPLTIVSGLMYECEQADCSDAAPLEELGPQRFWCDALTCGAIAYGFSQFHRLEIEFSDGKTRQSNVFETAGFDSVYTVTIRSDDLLVGGQFSPISDFPRTGIILLLCACLLVAGGLTSGLIVFLVRRRVKN